MTLLSKVRAVPYHVRVLRRARKGKRVNLPLAECSEGCGSWIAVPEGMERLPRCEFCGGEYRTVIGPEREEFGARLMSVDEVLRWRAR